MRLAPNQLGPRDAADHVLEAVYSTQVQTHCALETHGAVVDHRGDSATVYSSTQGTFAARDGLDEALGLKRGDYEVVCEYVGGGFGSKLNGPGKEGALAARVGAKHKRPVYLFCDRREDQTDTGNEMGLSHAEFSRFDGSERIRARAAVKARLHAAGAHAVIHSVADVPDLLDRIDRKLAAPNARREPFSGR